MLEQASGGRAATIISIRCIFCTTIRPNTNTLFGLLFGPNRIFGTALIPASLPLGPSWSRVRRPNHYTTEPPCYMNWSTVNSNLREGPTPWWVRCWTQSVTTHLQFQSSSPLFIHYVIIINLVFIRSCIKRPVWKPTKMPKFWYAKTNAVIILIIIIIIIIIIIKVLRSNSLHESKQQLKTFRNF